MFANPEGASDVLLHGSVMSNRYAKGFDQIHAAVIEVMRDALHQCAVPEVKEVRQWYASLDLESATAQLDALGADLNDMIEPHLMPNTDLMNKALERNTAFISKVVEKARRHETPGPRSGGAPLEHGPL